MFKNSIVEEFMDYLRKHGFNITQNGNEIIGRYKTINLAMKVNEDGFDIKSSENEFGYSVSIEESKRSRLKPSRNSFLLDNELRFPGSVKEPNDISFLKKEIDNLEQDIERLKAKLEKADEIEFVCVFDDRVAIDGEFSAVEEIIEKM